MRSEQRHRIREWEARQRQYRRRLEQRSYHQRLATLRALGNDGWVGPQAYLFKGTLGLSIPHFVVTWVDVKRAQYNGFKGG